jgi:hypothetical protein
MILCAVASAATAAAEPSVKVTRLGDDAYELVLTTDQTTKVLEVSGS